MTKPQQRGENWAEVEIVQIPETHIDRAWKEGAHKLAFGLLRYEPESTPDQLKYRLARKELILLGAMRDGEIFAWAAVTFIQYPMFRAMFIYSIYAPRSAVQDMFTHLTEYGRRAGASAIEGMADEAVARLWARKFEFKEVARLVRKHI